MFLFLRETQVSPKLCLSKATELRADGRGCVCVEGYSPDSSGTCTLAPPSRHYLHILIGTVCALGACLLVAAATACVRGGDCQQRDMAWRIRISELQFDDPAEVLGRGRYGQVRGFRGLCNMQTVTVEQDNCAAGLQVLLSAVSDVG